MYFDSLAKLLQMHAIYIKCCIFKAGRGNLLCRVHVDTTILCNRNQKVKYILLLLYKLLRKRNVVTLKPRVCHHNKGTARKLVDYTYHFFPNKHLHNTKWKCFSLFFSIFNNSDLDLGPVNLTWPTPNAIQS